MLNVIVVLLLFNDEPLSDFQMEQQWTAGYEVHSMKHTSHGTSSKLIGCKIWLCFYLINILLLHTSRIQIDNWLNEGLKHLCANVNTKCAFSQAVPSRLRLEYENEMTAANPVNHSGLQAKIAPIRWPKLEHSEHLNNIQAKLFKRYIAKIRLDTPH